MDYLLKLQKSISYYFLLLLVLLLGLCGLIWWAATSILGIDTGLSAILAAAVGFSFAYFAANALARRAIEPLKMVEQAILHVSPTEHGAVAPNLEKTKFGKELVTNLAMQVYQLASSAPDASQPTDSQQQGNKAHTVLSNLPVPILVMDNKQTIIYANNSTSSYLGMEIADIVGKSVYSVLDMSFNTDQTFDAWLAENKKNKVTATHSWERVRLNLPDQETKKQLDLVAYYNKNNPDNIETIITLFDKSNLYSREDEGIDFIALAVHELRTPITVLRGYIEVFEEELSGKLDVELEGYMQKMQVSAQQLSDFVGNILNVVRVDENQLFLQLHAEGWEEVLRGAAADMEKRASTHGKTIEFNIDKNIPPVAVDKVSIYEVINNLLDNAIKYSVDSNKIIVSSTLRDDGLVETTVQDFGIGIPGSTVGKLFEKFYRNHRTRAQIGGTGLGLYLSKAIVNAHDGQIWVNSREGQGSTFGFTLQPYDKLADKLKNNDNRDISRTAHGWIKNHSFYKR